MTQTTKQPTALIFHHISPLTRNFTLHPKPAFSKVKPGLLETLAVFASDFVEEFHVSNESLKVKEIHSDPSIYPFKWELKDHPH